MKKIIIYTLLALLVIILGVVIINHLSNPLRKPVEQIREDILKLTPIGTNMEDALELIENKEKWEIVWINNENIGMSLGKKIEHTDLSMDFIIGEKAVKATIGEYRNFFKGVVNVYWGFDENSKLIDVGIRKDSYGF